MPTRYEKRRRAFELSERLNALPEFKALPSVQERICFLHVNQPELRKEDIAEKLGLSSADVYAFFHSERWEIINQELAKQQLRELVQLSIKTLHECLKDKKGSVRLQAATTVLINAHLIEKEPKTVKQDNKLVVVWNSPNDEGIINQRSALTNGNLNKTGDISNPQMGELNGNYHSLCAAPETGGSPRIDC